MTRRKLYPIYFVALITLVGALFAHSATMQSSAPTIVQQIGLNPTGVANNAGFNFEAVVMRSTGRVYVGTTGAYGQEVAVINSNTNPNSFEATITLPTSGPLNFGLANQTTKLVYFRQNISATSSNIVVVDGRPDGNGQPANAALASINFTEAIQSFVLDEGRGLLYVITNNTSISPAQARLRVVDLNPASGTFHQVLDTYTLPAAAQVRAVAVNTVTNKVYVAAAFSNDRGIYVLDRASGSTQLVRIATTESRNGLGLIINQSVNLIYATNTVIPANTSNSLTVIDGATDTVLNSNDALPGVVNSAQPEERLAVNSVTGAVYLRLPLAGNQSQGRLVVLDGARFLNNDPNTPNPNFNTVVASIDIGNQNSAGDVFVDETLNRAFVNAFNNKLTYIINGGDNSIITTVPSTQLPSDIAYDPTTRRLYVANQQNFVQRINEDGTSENILTAVSTSAGVVNPVNNLLYMGHTTDVVGALHFDQDGTQGSVSGFPSNGAGNIPFVAVSNSTGRIYAINSSSNIAGNNFSPGHVAVIDPNTNAVITSIETGDQPFGIAVNQLTNKIYVANAGNPGAGSLAVIDGATSTVTTLSDSSIRGLNASNTFPSYINPVVNEATNKVYVQMSNIRDGANQLRTIGVIDGAGGSATALPFAINSVETTPGVTVQASIAGIRANKALNRVYLGLKTSNSNYLRVLDGSTDAVIATLNLGGGTSFFNFAVNEITGSIFVTIFDTDTVTVINGETNTVAGAIPVGDGPSAIAINAAANRIYVGNQIAKTISFINGQTLNVTDTLAVPYNPTTIAFDPATMRVYSNTVGSGAAEQAGLVVINDPASAAVPQANLAVTNTDNPDPASTSGNLTYTVQVTNQGQSAATGVTLTMTLTGSFNFVSANSTAGACNESSGIVTCNIGDLANGAGATVSIVVTPSDSGTINSSATVTGTEADPVSTNNTATQTTTVTLGNVFTVTNTNDSGPGSLRAALASADADQNKDTINFNIAPGGVQTITPLSQLFANSPVLIDGTSQPGFVDKPIIVLSGASGVQMSGIHFPNGNSRIRGLVINGFFYAGISTNGSNTLIEGNFIGTDASGNAAVPNGSGIDINAGANNLVGGTTAAARNVISGNRGNGIGVQAAATGTKIKGNYIGLRADGTGALPQPNWSPGVGLYSTSGAIVGGTEPGAGNVISGNKGPGIYIATTWPSGPGSLNNTIQGNLIGTAPDGNGALINEGGGISAEGGANNNLIGGTSAAARNVIANGVSFSNATANRVQGNYIGVRADGSARIVNTGWAGIQLRGSSGNFIGGDTPGAGNVISGNNGPGIWIVNTCTECNPPQPNVLSTNNYIQGNLIGTNSAGTAAIQNNGAGITLERGSTGNLIGGTSALARNIISGNNGDGVNIHNWTAPADGNTVQGNYIGTDITGTLQIANTSNGIGIFGVANTQVIGNVISGNTGGITIGAARINQNQPLVGATATNVYGNLIGTNAAGTAIIRNTYHGVSINGGSSNNHIGAPLAGARNIITGNGGLGVDINGSANGNTVQGNYIGTDVAGMTALFATVNGQTIYGNGSGVNIGASSNNIIGGTDPLARNLISGNNCQGVNIGNASTNGVITQASNNQVLGNYIGLNKDGTGYLVNPTGAGFGNKCSGVFIAGATNNIVGGTQPGAGNVIAGSQHQGVVISNANNVVGSGNTIQGNVIGTNVGLTAPLANGIGIFLINGASNNQIGGDDDDDGVLDGIVRAGNTIVGSTGDGINIQSASINNTNVIATGNTVQGNKIGGSTLLRNGNNGINLTGAANNLIGGTTPGAGNTISFNNNNGIVLNCPTLSGTVVCSVGNTIRQNSIFSHPNNIGIRFNANGANIGNNNQPAPAISFVSDSGGSLFAYGSLTTGVPNQAYVLELFSNDACSPLGQGGEGQTYIGTYDVTTDATGTVSFTTPALAPTAVGKIITATATHPTNGTSRFSQCAVVSPTTANISGRVTDEGTGISGATVTLSGGQSATATTDASGNYTFTNLPSNASYAVSASQSGRTFSPANWSFDKLRGNQIANFTTLKVQYAITDLGTLGGTNSFGFSLNELGQVVGNSLIAGNTQQRGFIYSNGTMTVVDTFGGTSSDARGINDSGTVVGNGNLANNTAARAFYMINGVKTDMGTFGGNSFGRGINNAGQITGYSDLPSGGGSRAFRMALGAVLNPATDNLGTLPGGTSSLAFSINESGHIAGYSTMTGGATHAFLYNGSSMQDLGTLGGRNSFAFWVNDSDVVAGRSEIVMGSTATRAVIFSNGTITDLGTLGGISSSGNAVNNSNVVVGHSEFNSGNQLSLVEAFIYKDGAMVNLNARIPANSGWRSLTTAQGINDAGQIVGYGVITINGQSQTHAFLLTPVANTKTDQTVTFGALANKTYGNAPFALSATASSNLPVMFSIVSGPATVNGNTLTITGAGAVTVRATQEGDETYNPASAEQTFTVAKKTLMVTADGKTRLYGAPDPAFTASYFGFANGDSSASLGGALAFTTNATTNSAVGNYTITPGGLVSNNYQFAYNSGTLTVDKASTSTASANYDLAVPGSVTLSAQVTIDAPAAGAVNEGSVTFTLRQGITTVATINGAQVTNGQASAAYNAGVAGAYTVYASYIPAATAPNFLGSTGLASLTIGNANPVPSITGLEPDSTIKKVTETGQFTLLINGNGFMSTQNGDPANSTVDWYDRTTGQHTNLTVTSIIGAQIQAVVPYTLIRDGKTVELSVNNVGPGGGTSNAQPFFITDTPATVTSSETVIPDPVSGTASTTSVTSTGAVLSAEASSGGSAGSGTLTVAQYSEDPIGTNASPNTSAFSTANGSGYFDVYVAPGSSFTSLSLDYCNTGGTTLYWWNGIVWNLVSNQTYNPGTQCITVTMTDTSSPSIAQLTGTVFGVASGPSVNSITVTPSSTVALGSGPITLNSSFTDAGGSGGPYTAEITWGDGQITNLANLTGPTLASTHAYSAAGTYAIKVKVSRGSSFGSSTFSPVVIYNPAAGFLTGGGWFNSPLGAFPTSPGFTGKVHFEASVKYESGKSKPAGMTKVTLPNMSFNATNFSYLSIVGTKVQVGGTGTINGAGSYGFLVTGSDGKLGANKQPDKLRIKIWNQATGQLIYDSQNDAASDAAPIVALGGGNVTIHK